MKMVIQLFFVTASLFAFSFSCTHCLPTVDGSGKGSSELREGSKGLTEGVERMMNFFDDVASMNSTIADMRTKLSALKVSVGNNYMTGVMASQRLDDSATRLETLSNEIESFDTGLDNLNISLRGIQTRMEALEEGQTKVLVDTMMQNPRAKLYTGLNHTGDFEYYDFISSPNKGGCYNLTTLKGKVKSVDTRSKCVRIFKNHNCHSWSQAFYPGSEITTHSILEGGESIGPCGTNEFEHATLQSSKHTSSKVVKKSDEHVRAYANVPDLVGDYWTCNNLASVYSDESPITTYGLGRAGNRLECIYGKIYLRHLLTTEDAEAKRIAGERESFFTRLALNKDTDEPGFALPLELGGPANKIFNVFPQNKAKVEEYRSFFVPQIKKYLEEYPNDPVVFVLSFMYTNDFTKRPAGVWYRLHKRGVGERTYGYISN